MHNKVLNKHIYVGYIFKESRESFSWINSRNSYKRYEMGPEVDWQI